jgi:glucosamine-6-phosphate deaminase
VILARQKSSDHAVLGLATGSTPIGIYRELIRMHRDEGLDFSDVVTFNLDEYFGVAPDDIHSYHRYMWENLFSHVNIARENVHIPRGDVPRDAIDAECARYEQAIRDAGGIDLQLLGIGKTGHIGFNEPGSAGPLNGEVFNALVAKVRGRSKLPHGRRIIVFSPHPDDDVISMGGMLHKLHQNGNEILVAYQTSGNIAVFDHEVRRYLDFVGRMDREFKLDDAPMRRLVNAAEHSLAIKKQGQVDSDEVQAIKRSIREAEAVSAIESFGMKREQARFLNLPFYQTGKVHKAPVGPEDVRITLALLESHRPELIFVAGDLSDPHGTHRMCLEVVERALAEYSGEVPELWYYRGAWQEWTVAAADVLVPLSEEELREKILAIFKHQSQKDRAPFPGQDEREFWQRVEDRNRSTAALIDGLGLPEYYAMEAYVVRKHGKPIDAPAVPTSALGDAPEH